MNRIGDRIKGPMHRFGFVMEQTLGHVTHYKNLRTTVDAAPEVQATWYPLLFAPRGTLETLPPLRTNWTLRASWRARRLLRQDGAERLDALFFHTQVTTLFSAGLMRRVPSVISLDATPINYDEIGTAYGHRRGGGVAEGLKWALNRRALHAARALVTWSEWARRSLIDDYGVDSARITVIPPGVDLALWPRPAPRAAEGPVRVLFVGADFVRKGGDLLLEVFTQRLRGRCELHLVTKGTVPPRPGVFVYRDFGPNAPGLRELYARCDLFVLPTLADCYSLAGIEAMALGMPIIATTVGGISEIVADGRSGFLITPNDGAALAHCLTTLLDAPDLRRRMGEEGRRIVEIRFDATRNNSRILEIMANVGKLQRKGAWPLAMSDDRAELRN